MKRKVKYKFGGLTKDDFLNAGASYVNYLGATAGGAVGNQDLIPEVGMSGDQATKDRWAKRSDIAENVGGMIGSTGAKIGLSALGVPPSVTALGQTAIGGATKNMTNQYNPEQVYSENYRIGGKMKKCENGGDITEYTGESHENGGIPIGSNVEVEGGENNFKGVVNSDAYKFNKHLVKGLKMNNIDISKYIGKTPAEAMRFEDKRYIREDDKYTKNALAREEKTGVGRFAVQNASSLIGDMVNPNPTMAKFGGRMKYELGGDGMSGGGTYYTDPQKEIDDINAMYGNNNTYNSIGNLSSFIGPAYDVARGLKGGDPVNYERVNPDLVDYSESRNQAKSEIKGNFRETQRKFKDVNNPATYLGLTANAAGQRDRAVSNALAQSFENEGNVNAQIKNQAKYANATTQRLEADARQMEKDISKNTLSTGLYNTGLAGSQYGADMKNDKASINAISSKYRDFKYDEKTGSWKFVGKV